MTYAQVKHMVQQHLEMVPQGTVEMHVAEDLAPRFIVMVERLADVRVALEQELSAHKGQRDVTYKVAIMAPQGKITAAEREASAKADESFLNSKQYCEELESQIQYVRTVQGVMENLHVFYRQCAKGAL